ncbi:hypothetical protein SDC9_145154 [bioreactor metagenome]|uniref:BppU N-terminal domain-containing protein n=1 Tax=bioreactor metagenome TaxID=1076179 RepID=A0A645EB26_9ZZZZ
MRSGELDIYIEQGTTWQLDLTIQQSDGTPMDLTGYTGRCQIRSSAITQSESATPTVTVTDPVNGKLTLSLSAEETSAIKVNGGSYASISQQVYDVELIDGMGRVMRILNGYARISPEVTR